MIVKEFFLEREDGVKLYKSYSDKNKYIKKIGTEEVYIGAIEPDDSPFEYEETEEDIPAPPKAVIHIPTSVDEKSIYQPQEIIDLDVLENLENPEENLENPEENKEDIFIEESFKTGE